MSVFGGLPEWPKGADCKSAGYAFDGSNPSPSTTLEDIRDKEESIAGVAQLVERQPSKLNVAGSNPVSRSRFNRIGKVWCRNVTTESF